MPQYCIVGRCTNSSRMKDISFFGFPNENTDKQRYRLWVNFVRQTRKDFTSPGRSHSRDYCKICSSHFVEADYVRKFNISNNQEFTVSYTRRLISTAYPTVKTSPTPPPKAKQLVLSDSTRSSTSSCNVIANAVCTTGATSSCLDSPKTRCRGSIATTTCITATRHNNTSEFICTPSRSLHSVPKRRKLSMNRARSKDAEDLIKLAGIKKTIPDVTAKPQNAHVLPVVEAVSAVMAGFSFQLQLSQPPQLHVAASPRPQPTYINKGSQVDSKLGRLQKKHVRSRATMVKGTTTMKDKGTKSVAIQTTAPNEELSSVTVKPVVPVEHCTCCKCITADDDDELFEGEVDNQEKDPDWTPDGQNSHPCYDSGVYDQQPFLNTPSRLERKLIVFESHLLALFNLCPVCYSPSTGRIHGITGSLVTVLHECSSCRFHKEWRSQPILGDIPAGNILLSAGIMFSGSNPTKFLRGLSHVGLVSICRRTFDRHQQTYLQPAIVTVWERAQVEMVNDLQQRGKPLLVGGDARNDSPGHTAKYGSYSFVELSLNKVLHVELVQKNEVGNSYRMEMEGLKRGLKWIEDNNLAVDTLVTDRHGQVKTFLEKEKPDLQHKFDVWHINKNVSKRLRKIQAKTDCGIVGDWMKSIANHTFWCATSTPDGNENVIQEKFLSILNHVMNIHEGHGDYHQKCHHGELSEDDRKKKWIAADSKAAEELVLALENKYLLAGIRKMSPLVQTSLVEAFHSLNIQFCPKMYAYSWRGMLCRLYLSALHFNENTGRDTAHRKDGSDRYKITYPRARSNQATLRKILTDSTYFYVEDLMCEVEYLTIHKLKDGRQILPKLQNTNVPAPLATDKVRPVLAEMIAAHRTRFARVL